MRVALGGGELEELVDQAGEAVDVPLDPVERGLGVGPGPGQLDGEAEPGQRGPQLVRDVLEQPALGGHQGLDPGGHPVEGPGQLAELVAAGRADPGRQVAAAEEVDGPPEPPERPGQVDGQAVAEQHDNQQDPQVIRQEIAPSGPGRGHDQEPRAAVLGDPGEDLRPMPAPAARRRARTAPRRGQGLERRSVGPVGQVPAGGVDQEMLGAEELVEPSEVDGELVGAAIVQGLPGPFELERLGLVHHVEHPRPAGVEQARRREVADQRDPDRGDRPEQDGGEDRPQWPASPSVAVPARNR